MQDYLKWWPIVVTLVVMLSGFVKVQADLEDVMGDINLLGRYKEETLAAMPVIQYKIEALQKQADKVEGIQQKVLDTIREEAKKLDDLSDLIKKLNGKRQQ